jgi:D-inositol-3-phosphate glycosyltransferase
VIAYHSSPLLEPGAGDAGGMTVYVREVARAMAKLQFRTDVFTRSASGSIETTDIFPGVRVIAIPAGPVGPVSKTDMPRYIGDFVSGVRAFALGSRSVYDVVHSHYWQSGIAGADLASMWRVPHIHSNHTLAKVKNRYLPPGDNPEPLARLDGEARVIESADILIASTDDEWEHLACLYGASHDRIKRVYPGVDHGSFHPDDQAQARAGLGFGDELIVTFVGRVQPLKGLDLALEAVHQLVPALDRDVRLVIVGGDSGGGFSEQDRLTRLAVDLGIPETLHFAGPQPHDRTPSFYRAADAAVVCSYSESFGLSALEAQACGIPVVGTDVGGLRHVVRDGYSGYLVGTRDPSDFAARLKTLLADDDLRAEFSGNAIESAASFTWERTGRELADLYECLVTERLPEACTC